MASLRSIVPRATLSFHSKQLQHRLRPIALRSASTSPPKPRVLEKPERFNPPSHPSRLRSRPRQYPGPPLSEHERKAQKTRRYPNMMPGEGTFLHWFLTSRMLHVWITMSILISLVVGTWWIDFLHNSPDTALLPPNSMLLTHPLASLRRYFDVYWMYVEHTSAITAEKRRQKLEDVNKRSQYRKAHGLDKNEGFGGWMAKTDEELEAAQQQEASPARPDQVNTEEGDYMRFEGHPQPVRKKWFGIW